MTLNYTTREINRNFKIKVSGIADGAKVNTLVGVEMANKMLARAFNTPDDKQVCKLRRGIKVTFYYV